MPAEFQLLGAIRLTAIMKALQDKRDQPQQLLFSQRVQPVDAIDGEIMGKFIGHVQIADIIADDAKAAVYSTDRLQYETTNVPNLKHGVSLTQAWLNQLNAIQTRGTPNDQGIFSNYRMTIIDRLLLGIRQRIEALNVAMYLDGFSYDRLGIKMTNVSWGMPSDLKVTVSTAWDNSGSATPMSDILLQKRYAAVRYGEYYDQIDMSTAAFNYMTLTTDFQNRARYYLPGGIAASALPNLSEEEIMPVVKKVLGVSVINLYDARYWQQAPDGTVASAPYLPITKVILSSTADNGDPTAHDFANGIVTESLIGGLSPTNMIGAFAGPTRGPVAYATAPADLNPPNLTIWGCARGFPRKYRMAASSVLTVGSFSDPIPTTDVAFT